MSKIKNRPATLSGLVDSDSEVDHFVERDVMPTLDSSTKNNGPGKKVRGRPMAVSKITAKAKAPARRSSDRLSKKRKDPTAVEKKGKRKVLADKTNQQPASDTEELDEFAQDEVVIMNVEVEDTIIEAKQIKPKPTKKKPTKAQEKAEKKGARRNTKETIQDVPVPAPKGRPGRKKATAKPDVMQEPLVILESQIPDMEVDQEAEVDEVVEQIVSRTTNNSVHSRLDSRIGQSSVLRKRPRSASDTERSDSASLRRKLGEKSKQYEALHIKYQDLKEIATNESNRNFEKLDKNTREKTTSYNALIASLKITIATQASIVNDTKGLKKKFESQTTELFALKAQVSQLNTSLTEAQTENKTQSTEKKALLAENKTLSAKLAANRSAASSVESANVKVPGSAMKANGGIRLMGTAEAAQVAQAAQLKEDIYSDLTGLIIRSVKREAEVDIFDCIQTGRNGTLHFKLAAANDKSADNYNDGECTYTPQLDPSRDKDLIKLLPEYLVDEITFPRLQAARFFARVVKALTEKIA